VDNPVFIGRMGLQTASERFLQQEVEQKMEEIRPSETVDGLPKEGNSQTRLNRPFLRHAAWQSAGEAGGAGSAGGVGSGSLLWWCS
jgi:hypothetical protein